MKTQKRIFAILWISTSLGTFSLLAPWGLTLRLWMFVAVILGLMKIVELANFEKIKNKYFVLACICYLFAIIFSGFNAIDINAWLARCISSFLLISVSILISQIQDATLLKKAVKTIILFGAIFSCLAVFEIYLSYSNPSIYQLLHAFDIDGNPGEKQLGTIAFLPRARGYFIEPNEFSQYLLLPTGLAIARGFLAHKFTGGNDDSRALAFIFLILVIAQIATLSRGGFLGLFVQIFIVLAFKRYYGMRLNPIFFTRLNILIISTAFFSLLIMNFFSHEVSIAIDVLKYLGTRFSTTATSNDPTLMLRFSSTFMAFEIWTQDFSSFLSGIGIGNLQYSSLGGYTSSNLAADIAAEMGLVGLITFTGIIFTLVIPSINQIKRFRKGRINFDICILSIGGLLSTTGLLIGGLTYATHNLLVLWISFGLLASANNIKSTVQSVKYRSRSESVEM